jgi:dTDP-4-amino-4,6-dideoxygalactose transaminase
VEPIVALARQYGLYVVEDCAQAIGARYQARRVGSLGICGCLSFYPTKNLGAYGDGGMVVTNDAALADRLDILRRQGGKQKYRAEFLGFNSRLDSIQAAILAVKLQYLDGWNERRRAVAHRYNELLKDFPVTPPCEARDVYHVYHQYTIRARERDQLAVHLKARGIGTMVYYPVPLHRQELYADLGYPESSLPESERASKQVLSLPMYPELSASQQEEIGVAVREFYGK